MGEQELEREEEENQKVESGNPEENEGMYLTKKQKLTLDIARNTMPDQLGPDKQYLTSDQNQLRR